ncbi:immunoglobulin-like domain-containing protein [Formosa maritima]|uniref:DUF5011 domain-containing protein n=1 Tax=Formosa maritima TaxID=2592046 RepID=A0A5D0GBX4_9FLAO|nr:immunoglobulin-like domain-containing protein [Formosa maritima]TYA55272.1 DUF5011 domain-containing protein [Formosa maritima]
MIKRYFLFLNILFSAVYSYGQCVITCPDDVIITCINDLPSLLPTTTVDCGAITLQTYTLTGATSGSSPSSGINDASIENYLAGTTTVTYYIEVASGNSTTCSFNVIVYDYTDPWIECTGDIYRNNDPLQCSAYINMYAFGVFPSAAVVDGCSGLFVEPTGIPTGGVFPIGTTTVTWTATDLAGNSVSCTQDVTVTDTENPTIVCPSNIVVNTNPGQCVASVNIPLAIAQDNCSIISVTNDYNGGGADASDTYPLGTTTVTFTATDSANRTTTCSFNVTVENSQDPIMTLLGDNPLTIEACDPYIEYGATAIDSCAGDISNTIVISPSQIDTDEVGTFNITYTLPNASGNVIQVIRAVHIVDTTAPTLTLVGPNPLPIGDCSTYTELGVIVNDPCFGDISGESTTTITITSNVDTSVLGSYTVTYNATDASGNAALPITRTVIVSDVSEPEIVLIGDNPQIIEACDVYSELGATAIDPCNGTDYLGDIVIDTSALNTNVVGTYQVTYNVEDSIGNMAIEVIRNVEVVDTTGPEITLNNPNPQIIEACTAYVELGATAIDLCSGIDYTGDIVIDASAVNVNVVGTYQVFYNVVDVYGNPAVEMVRDVEVVDTTLPIISCPMDITVGNDTNLCSAVVNYTTPIGTDTCSAVTTTQIAGITSGGVFPIGTTINTFQVEDAYGNIEICSFNVIVNDTQAPSIICPSDMTVGNDVGLCSAIVTYTIPIGNDNCSGSTTIQTAGLAPGSVFPLGTTINTFQVTDTEGNTATCSFDVTVTDTENPVAICQDISLELDPVTGTVSIVPSDIDNGSTDNCNVNLSLSQSSFDCTNLGVNTVTLTVTDDFGNTSTCDALVTITDISSSASVSITASETIICDSQEVTFTATPVNGGTSPSYQWQVNGIDMVGETGAIFITSTLVDGDEVTVLMTSDVSICALPQVSNIITITVNDFNAPANAGADITNVICTNTTITLAGNTITGSGSVGLWTVTSGQVTGFSFSDASSSTSTFTGDIGETYTLTWTIDNPSPCIDTSDSMTVTFVGCNALDFDGFDDNITFRDNYNLNSDFSIEVWIKSESTNNNIQTIISKRESNNLIDGYDLRLENNVVSFHWNDGESITASPIEILPNIWHHVAVTFGSGNYTLYIDGIVMASIAGSLPISNTVDCILGAMDQTLVPPFKPLHYFDGVMDELRIWNVALSDSQIRKMMNQEVNRLNPLGVDDGLVHGDIIPLPIPGLSWTDLNGYYQMNQTTDLAGGNLLSISDSAINGVLRYMTTLQPETAPIPYQTTADGSWTNSNTWLYGNSQLIPNSMGLDGTTSIDWNIVRTSHNVSSGDRNITLLGLEVNANTLSIENTDPLDGQSLTVSDYLIIDGTNSILRLVGESQLIQDTGSMVDYSGTGLLKRDQQGTSNYYNYNYWGSPVSLDGSTYTIGDVLYDGTQPVLWTTAHNANPSTNPITLSSRWLYLFENYPFNNYADWHAINEDDVVQVGLGYLMKGSGSAGTDQNYTFVGKPNNGSISTPITATYEALVGNPYPSAIDADEFINDNTSSIEGTLYFWEHYITNNTHVTVDYQGGYAAYNLSGGNPAVSPPEISGLGTPSKIPERYIPVGQGFNVKGNATGGLVIFENDQRVFVKEAVTGAANNGSVFIRSGMPLHNLNPEEDIIKRIRLDFKTPEGAKRPLLLAFVPNQLATDGFDYGYDAINTEVLPNDMSWMIADETYVIQGVGDFDETKYYPLGIFLETSGTIEISLKALENFEEDIDVFVYDSLYQTYTLINDSSFVYALEAETYTDRFYITFQSNSLTIGENTFDNISVNYLQNPNEIYIKTPTSVQVKKVQLINLLGQDVFSWDIKNSSEIIRIPVKRISEGPYVVKVTTDSGIINKKVLISY